MKISILLSGLLLAGSMTAAQAQGPVNVALGKKFVSSDPNTREWGTGLTDGSWVAARGTTFATNDSITFPKAVTVDLETAQNLGYVALGVPPFGSTKTVSVALSTDGTNFTEVGKVTFPEAEEKKVLVEFKGVSARYVRLVYVENYTARHKYQATYGFTTELAAYAPGPRPELPPSPVAVAMPAAPAPQPADAPAPKLGANGEMDQRFAKAHESFLQRGKAGPIGVLFLGDSITDRWRNENAKDSWATFLPYNPANFGIGGDKTQHVLWRLANGELAGIDPKVVVLMIGTNNTRLYSAPEIAKADAKIVAEIHRQLPKTKVLLLGVFPRGASATDPARAKIKAINNELEDLADGNKTRYLDIGDKFLQPDGSLSAEVMPDALHPSPKGYVIWAEAIKPVLDEMMK